MHGKSVRKPSPAGTPMDLKSPSNNSKPRVNKPPTPTKFGPSNRKSPTPSIAIPYTADTK